jgi:hypothetical protein
LETEYAVAELRSGGHPEHLVQQLMEVAASRLVHLPGHRDAGLFTANGSRLYLDVGGHPEVATPEVQDPWEAVRYVKAGDRIMLELAEALRGKKPRLDPLVLRGNVDYSGQGTTWGCHESYLHVSQLDSEALAAQLIPHLVSRIVFAGAGGFNPRSQGIEFTLSPRAWHLRRAISNASTDNRGIFHTREESLCGEGYRRLHLLCGDSLCSETSLWLTIASTALVVALIEAGKTPGEAVGLRQPVRTLRRFAADPGLKTRVAVAGGGRRTAIGIQRHYLEQAERHAGAEFMPAWAAEACRRWRLTLDQLEHAPHESARTLDWQIKLTLYRDRVRQSSLTAEQVAHWNSVVTAPPLPPADPLPDPDELPNLPDSIRRILRDPSAVSRVEASLRDQGLSMEEAQPFLQLRAKLLELETRYSALGPAGVFECLDGAGVLSHRVVGQDEIENARVNPPAAGRARLRGEAVRRLAADGKGSCHWTEVWDSGTSQILDLSDPFETEERWRAPRRSRLARLLSRRGERSRRFLEDLDLESRYDRP